MAHATERVEKIMALDLAEFHRSLKMLAPGQAMPPDACQIAVDANGKHVDIAFEPLPPETLGGLLALPRARVTLAFEGHSAGERAAFLARFDRAFQRGGG